MNDLFEISCVGLGIVLTTYYHYHKLYNRAKKTYDRIKYHDECFDKLMRSFCCNIQDSDVLNKTLWQAQCEQRCIVRLTRKI